MLRNVRIDGVPVKQEDVTTNDFVKNITVK